MFFEEEIPVQTQEMRLPNHDGEVDVRGSQMLLPVMCEDVKVRSHLTRDVCTHGGSCSPRSSYRAEVRKDVRLEARKKVRVGLGRKKEIKDQETEGSDEASGLSSRGRLCLFRRRTFFLMNNRTSDM